MIATYRPGAAVLAANELRDQPMPPAFARRRFSASMGATMSNRIAIVLLACAAPPYDRTVDAIRQTWGTRSLPGVDVR